MWNGRRNPRVALSIETDWVASIGWTEYLVVYGTARVEEGGAPELVRRLARLHLGSDVPAAVYA